MNTIRGWRFIAAALVLTWAGTGLGQGAYETLPASKALAVSTARPEAVRAVVHSQPNELRASILAREQCQAQAAAAEVCEVVRLNDLNITTGAGILDQVPDVAHPLFLWRYQHASTVLYLAGSVHILKPSLYPLPAQLEDAFDSADYLVLEVDVASIDPTELQRRTLEYASLAPGQTLTDVLPPSLHARLDRHLADFGLSVAMLRTVKPAMVMNQLLVARLLTLGYLPDSGLENHFLSRRRDQQVLELETLDDQLELLFNQPMPTQIQLLTETLETEPEVEPLLANMLVAWLSGDDDAFLELFKAQSGESELSRTFLRKLLDDRNHTMATSIRDYLQTAEPGASTTYFVLVGAAHLVGENGIVEVLSRAGIEGERISSTDRIITREPS